MPPAASSRFNTGAQYGQLVCSVQCEERRQAVHKARRPREDLVIRIPSARRLDTILRVSSWRAEGIPWFEIWVARILLRASLTGNEFTGPTAVAKSIAPAATRLGPQISADQTLKQ